MQFNNRERCPATKRFFAACTLPGPDERRQGIENKWGARKERGGLDGEMARESSERVKADGAEGEELAPTGHKSKLGRTTTHHYRFQPVYLPIVTLLLLLNTERVPFLRHGFCVPCDRLDVPPFLPSRTPFLPLLSFEPRLSTFRAPIERSPIHFSSVDYTDRSRV